MKKSETEDERNRNYNKHLEAPVWERSFLYGLAGAANQDVHDWINQVFANFIGNTAA